MRVFAVANQKGGVGKTTTTVNLAAPLAVAGRSTLILDLDPHGSLSSYFGFDPDIADKSTYRLFQNNNEDPFSLIKNTGVERLDIIPAHSALATLDRQLGAKEGKGLVIVNALEKLRKRYAYVFIDCPPVLGVLMVNALAACERLMIPVQSEFLALKGLEGMVRTLNMITSAKGTSLPYTIVPTMYDQDVDVARDSLQMLKDIYPYNIWDDVIPYDTQFKIASEKGVPLAVLNPRSQGSIAYRKLLTTLLRITYEQDQKTSAVA